jgi:hypothetical protein
MERAKEEDPRHYDKEIPCKDAEKLRKIILTNFSLWAIAAYSYNLGRISAASKI